MAQNFQKIKKLLKTLFSFFEKKIRQVVKFAHQKKKKKTLMFDSNIYPIYDDYVAKL